MISIVKINEKVSLFIIVATNYQRSKLCWPLCQAIAHLYVINLRLRRVRNCSVHNKCSLSEREDGKEERRKERMEGREKEKGRKEKWGEGKEAEEEGCMGQCNSRTAQLLQLEHSGARSQI